MTHLTDKQIQQLCRDHLDTEETETLLGHLDECEPCLDRMNQWLDEQGLYSAIKKDLIASDVFERDLMRRINRHEATRNILHFSVDSFFKVFAFLAGSLITLGLGKSTSAKRSRSAQ